MLLAGIEEAIKYNNCRTGPPGTDACWLVFDSYGISIISIHEIKQPKTDLSLKLALWQSHVNAPGMEFYPVWLSV